MQEIEALERKRDDAVVKGASRRPGVCPSLYCRQMGGGQVKKISSQPSEVCAENPSPALGELAEWGPWDWDQSELGCVPESRCDLVQVA